MSGWLTNGVASLSTLSGNETASFDTQISGEANPQTGGVSLAMLANEVLFLTSNLAAGKTMVAGTRYYSSITLGTPQTLTGISVLLGGTGGTDLWCFELFNSAGVLVATSLAAGTTAGTAATWQQLAFTTPYALTTPGQYFISVQSNGTTAKFAAYNSPTSPYLVGSATGTLGTPASITAPTTYTANLGPIALVY